MTDTIAPTPERGQHDDIVVDTNDRSHVTRSYLNPVYERWHSKGIIDDRQRNAAQTYVEARESIDRGARSSLASLDRVDYASAGLVEGEYLSEAMGTIASVQDALGPAGVHMIDAVLLYRKTPEQATGKHKHVARGMVVMALEVMAVTLGK